MKFKLPEKQEMSYVMVKPDGIQRGLVGNVISRFENAGLKIAGMKMFLPSREDLLNHYGKDDAWCLKIGTRLAENFREAGKEVTKEPIEYGREVLEGLISYMMSGPVVAFVVAGNQSVAVVRKLVGGTEPKTSDVGTIRGDFTTDSYDMANIGGRAVRNLIHCSESVEEAERELAIWFPNNEGVIKYKTINETLMYDMELLDVLGE